MGLSALEPCSRMDQIWSIRLNGSNARVPVWTQFGPYFSFDVGPTQRYRSDLVHMGLSALEPCSYMDQIWSIRPPWRWRRIDQIWSIRVPRHRSYIVVCAKFGPYGALGVGAMQTCGPNLVHTSLLALEAYGPNLVHTPSSKWTCLSLFEVNFEPK